MASLAIPAVEETARQLEEVCAAGAFTDAGGYFATLTPQLELVTAILTDVARGDVEIP